VAGTLLARVLPNGAVAAETSGDPPVDLFPVEEPAIAEATGERRREFATGRACARTALDRLGYRPVALPRDDGGAPIWPHGVVGSITHCAGYRAAAVAPVSVLDTVGVDAEPNVALPSGMDAVVALPEERDQVAVLLRRSPGIRWDRLLFSAKEAVYKAVHPLTGMWLEFPEVAIRFGPSYGRFSIRLVGGFEAAPCLTGRWAATRRLLVTAAVRMRNEGLPGRRT
jgi:4'-phosphopantetheinyl transferase EntD